MQNKYALPATRTKRSYFLRGPEDENENEFIAAVQCSLSFEIEPRDLEEKSGDQLVKMDLFFLRKRASEPRLHKTPGLAY